MLFYFFSYLLNAAAFLGRVFLDYSIATFTKKNKKIGSDSNTFTKK